MLGQEHLAMCVPRLEHFAPGDETHGIGQEERGVVAGWLEERDVDLRVLGARAGDAEVEPDVVLDAPRLAVNRPHSAIAE